MPMLMSIAEVMEQTGLSRTTVRRAISRNELKSKKIGRRRVIRRVDFERWMDPEGAPEDDNGGAPSAHH